VPAPARRSDGRDLLASGGRVRGVLVVIASYGTSVLRRRGDAARMLRGCGLLAGDSDHEHGRHRRGALAEGGAPGLPQLCAALP